MANQKITELALIGGIDVSNDMIPIVDVSVAAGVGETKKVAPSQLKVALALDNVSNTSDANKPVSTATQTALDLKQDALTLTTTGSSGPATLVGATLNIPQYSGGGGGGGGSGTVTSVAALTLGTTGTDLSSSVANSTTTPVITLNVPNASASNRGALTSTDWSTFNGKQDQITAGTISQYYRGDKTFQTLDKTAVGLGNVANADTTNAANISSGVLAAARIPTNLNGQIIQNFIPNVGGTGVNLTLNSANAATWNSSVITLTGALTITFDASLPNGFNVTLIQLDAATSTITGTGGLVIGNRQGHGKNNGQYSVVSIIKYTNVLAILGGDTSL
jgi:hypothetical protein